MNYRFDNRSEEQFKHDIKARTMEERALFLMWLDLLEKETGTRPNYTDNGCGKNGEFLEDSKVNTDPDFDVEGYGKVEVKFSKPMLDKKFHLKLAQVRQYKNKKASILMVNGADSDVPQFTIIKPDALERISKECQVVNWQGFGFKQAYRISVDRFIWRDLK